MKRRKDFLSESFSGNAPDTWASNANPAKPDMAKKPWQMMSAERARPPKFRNGGMRHDFG